MDENSEFAEAGNIVNEVLLAHKDKWADETIRMYILNAWELGYLYKHGDEELKELIAVELERRQTL
jgi:hypothetical protein